MNHSSIGEIFHIEPQGGGTSPGVPGRIRCRPFACAKGEIKRVALCLALITLVIAVKARSAEKKNSEEIAKNTELITANSEEIRKSKEGLGKKPVFFMRKESN